MLPCARVAVCVCVCLCVRWGGGKCRAGKGAAAVRCCSLSERGQVRCLKGKVGGDSRVVDHLVPRPKGAMKPMPAT